MASPSGRHIEPLLPRYFVAAVAAQLRTSSGVKLSVMTTATAAAVRAQTGLDVARIAPPPPAGLRVGSPVPTTSASCSATVRAGRVGVRSFSSATAASSSKSAVPGQAILGFAILGDAGGFLGVQATAATASVRVVGQPPSLSASMVGPPGQVRERAQASFSTLNIVQTSTAMGRVRTATATVTVSASIVAPTARLSVNSTRIATASGIVVNATFATVTVRSPRLLASSSATATTPTTAAVRVGSSLLWYALGSAAGIVSVRAGTPTVSMTLPLRPGVVAPSQQVGGVAPQEELAYA